MRGRPVLILGGTAYARIIADALVEQGHDVVTSLAGVTRAPLLAKGRLRTGGFGGVAGLVDYIGSENIRMLIDATHPFAAIMSAHAVAAAAQTGVPLLRLERPAWQPRAGDRWISVNSMEEAAHVLPAGARVLVTTGRKGLTHVFARQDVAGVIRSIEPPDEALPAAWRLLLDRPPHTLASEMALLGAEHITHVLSKNAGGDATRAKLDAAREMAIPVVMIDRPQKPKAACFGSVDELLSAVGKDLG